MKYMLLVCWDTEHMNAQTEPEQPEDAGAKIKTHQAFLAPRMVTSASKWSTRRSDSALRCARPAGVSL